MTLTDEPNDTIIIGAGLAGLSAAYHLKSNYKWTDRNDHTSGDKELKGLTGNPMTKKEFYEHWKCMNLQANQSLYYKKNLLKKLRSSLLNWVYFEVLKSFIPVSTIEQKLCFKKAC